MCLRLVRFNNLQDGADFAYKDEAGQNRLAIKVTDDCYTDGKLEGHPKDLNQRVIADDSWIKVLEQPRQVF